MAAQDQSIVDLLKTALANGQELVRTELALAKTELRQEISRIQIGIGHSRPRRSPRLPP